MTDQNIISVDSEEVVNQDIPSAINTLKELKAQLDPLQRAVTTLTDRIENGEIKTARGVSFLETKNHLMLSYLTNLVYLMLRKSHGKKIEGEAAIKRLVEIRTVMERMRPIERKLQYQIDKLIRNATGQANSDPLRFRANPDNLVSREEETSRGDNGVKRDVYVPPKLAPMTCAVDESEADRRKSLLQRAKKRAMSSSIMSELRREFDTAPEEIVEEGHVHSYKLNQRQTDAELREYEEDLYKRVKITNKNKSLKRKPAMSTSLSDLAQFEDMRILYDEDTKLNELMEKKGSYNKKRKTDGVKRSGKGKGPKGKGKKFKKKMK